MLADLPEELLQELRETTLVLNMETILEVIDRIEAHAPETAKGLRGMVENFKIGRIQYLQGFDFTYQSTILLSPKKLD